MATKHLPILAACLLCTAALAAPRNPGAVDVIVTNDASTPIPVTLAPAARTVVCTQSLGSVSGGNDSPFRRLSGLFGQSLVQCPAGVQRIDVKRIGFTPDLGSRAQNAASFRITAGVQDSPSNPGSIPPPGGILAVLTDGAPVATVVQNYVLDTLDPSKSIYYEATISSGIASVNTTGGGILFFIGTPLN